MKRMSTILNRFSVWLRNLWHWRTAWAYRHLAKQMQKDRGYAESWQANIAMTIYDATKDDVLCRMNFPEGSALILHSNQCNALADRLMSHLFGVKLEGGLKAE